MGYCFFIRNNNMHILIQILHNIFWKANISIPVYNIRDMASNKGIKNIQGYGDETVLSMDNPDYQIINFACCLEML